MRLRPGDMLAPDPETRPPGMAQALPAGHVLTWGSISDQPWPGDSTGYVFRPRAGVPNRPRPWEVE